MFAFSFTLNSLGSMSIVFCSFSTILKANILRFYEKFEYLPSFYRRSGNDLIKSFHFVSILTIPNKGNSFRFDIEKSLYQSFISLSFR